MAIIPSDNQPLIDLSTPQAQNPAEEPINLYDDRDTSWPPSMELATLRAWKADYGLGALSPGVDTITNSYINRTNEAVRAQVADKQAILNQQNLLNTMKDEAGKPDADPSLIQGLAGVKVRPDSDTIYENAYGNALINSVASMFWDKNPPSVANINNLDKDTTFSPEVLDLTNVAADIVARKEYAQRKAEDIEGGLTRFEQQRQSGDLGFFDYLKGIWNTGKTFIPLYSYARATDAISDLGIKYGLPGTRMEDFVARMYQLPQPQFKQEFDRVMDRLADSPYDAAKFARAVASYSNNEKFLDNVFGVLDIASAVPVSAGAKAVTSAAETSSETGVRRALREAIRATGDEPVKLPDTLDRLGATEQASVVSFYERMKQQFQNKDPFGYIADLEKRLPSMFNPKATTTDRVNLSREGADRLEAALNDIYGSAFRLFSNTLMVQRVPDEAIAAYIAEAGPKIKAMYTRIENGLLDIKHIPAEDNAANVHNLKYEFGRPDGQLFGADGTEAQYFAREVFKFPDGSWKIEPQGIGTKLTMVRPVDESDPVIRGHLITTGNTTPQSFLNYILGRVRTPEDTLSQFQRNARHVSVHSSQQSYAIARGVTDRYIKPLSGEAKSRLERLLDHNHLQVNEETGYPGVWYKTQGEYARGYRSLFGVEPSEAESAAYFAATSLSDVDYVVRNLNLHGDLNRLGLTHFRVSTTDENGHPFQSPWFFGKVVDRLPPSAESQAGIVVIEDGANKGWLATKGGKKIVGLPDESVQSIFLSKNMTTQQRELIDAKLAQGYKIVQIGNANEKPLQAMLGSPEVVHFAVLKNYEEKALPWQLIEYRPGGHTEYQWKHWVKQAVVSRAAGGRTIYEGDKTIFSFNSEAEARKYAERVSEAQRLFRDGSKRGGDMRPFEDFVANNLPRQVGSDIKSGIIDKLNPVTHVRSGQNVLDAPHMRSVKDAYIGLEDQVNNPYNLMKDVDRRFVGRRDPLAYTVAERGTDANPLFALERAKTFDTKSAIVRGVEGAIKSRFFNDYRTAAAESFAREFGHLLVAKKGSLNSDPLFHLFHPEWKGAVNDYELQAAKVFRQNVLDLLQVDTDKTISLAQLKESLLNTIYKRGGQSWSNGRFVNDWMLPFVKDPGSYFRATAFHSTMGLFNPVQWFTQIQTLTHVAGVAGPVNGAKGLSAGVLMRKLAATDERNIVEHYAGISHKLGFMDRDKFMDSYEWLHKSGWYNVEGEHALIDDLYNPKIWSNGKDSFLHAGTYFFREGERMTRLAGWNAAYLEWAAKNPGKILNNAAATEVLGRARMLTGDMVRDATASWSRGIWSIPTQFLNYPARLAEQLMPFAGKRLTSVEKARAIATYTAMYGIPVGLGVSVGAWPMYDMLRSEAISRGYTDENASIVTKTMLEGIPSMIWTMITGSNTAWSQRMGPQGTQFFKDILSKDKSFTDVAFGASGSIVGNMIRATYPMYQSLFEFHNPKLFLEDLIDASRNFSSVNNAAKLAYALGTGKYISRSSEGPVTDISAFDAFVSSFLGPLPRRITDTYLGMQINKSQEDTNKTYEQYARKDFNRALTAWSKGDMETGNTFWTRAQATLTGAGVPEDEIDRFVKGTINAYGDLADKVDWDLVNKSRSDRQQIRQRALEEKLKAKQQR